MKGTGEISINDCPLARMRSAFFSSSLTSNRLGSDQLLKERKQRDFDQWLSSRAHAVSLEPPHELMTHEPLRRRRSWGEKRASSETRPCDPQSIRGRSALDLAF